MDKHRQRGESAGEPGLLYTFGYWVFSKKHDIAILRWHSDGKHSSWKTFLVLGNRIVHFGNSWDFQGSDQRKGRQCEGRVARSAKSTAEVHPVLTFLYFDIILFLYCIASSYRVWTRWKPRHIWKQKLCCTVWYRLTVGVSANAKSHNPLTHCTSTKFVAGLQSEVFTFHCFEIKGIWNETVCK